LSGIIKQLLEVEGAQKQTYQGDRLLGVASLGSAVRNGNLEIVKMLLEHDPDLVYIRTKGGSNAFSVAAHKGFVSIAQEIIRVCPDSAYATDITGANALHAAILNEHTDFVNYILATPKLHRLIHQADNDGDLPLHAAARSCNPKLLHSLLNYQRQDYTAFNINNFNAVDFVYGRTNLFKTLKWVYIYI
jgi:ankyrin repeat protein